ncbi:alpha/beta hydrolase family protein [Nonomuraea rhodomycinica]|uniref:Lipase n=1 Tax=Nonomuraea rhodomycinica TaxID=1712872 RepID=A0A7Y6IPJ1_9ACTN|nr:lipase [Nonomuraea rhodomycinica]NUW42052.1 lipase [Nonomuraea rhodomycinica]
MSAFTRVRGARVAVGLGLAAALLAAPAAPASAAPASASASAARTAGGTTAADAIRFSLPAPTVRRPIGTVALRLVDRSRPDPLVTSRPYRELMVSVWYPARRADGLPLAPQMPPLAAAGFDRDTASDLGVKPGQVDWAATRTHARAGAPADRSAGRLPVVLFSPGYEAPRTLSTVLAEELAARGYAVVTVDHTHEPDQVEFPGGRVEHSELPPVKTEEDQTKLFKVLLEARVADLRFVLDELARLNRASGSGAGRGPLPAGLASALDLSRVGAFGHSMGGATAAQLLRDDPRVDAGANLDGIMLGPAATLGVTRPFLQVAGQTTTRDSEPTWKSFWNASTGWKREARFTGAQHFSFFDLQAIYPQLAGRLKGLPIAETIGTIDPERSVAAQRAYLAAFFDLHLRGRRTPLFDGPSRAYPEVTLVP